MTRKWVFTILGLAILVMLETFIIGYICLRLKWMNYNMNVLYYNQQVFQKELEKDSNSIKIQLPEGAKLDSVNGQIQ